MTDDEGGEPLAPRSFKQDLRTLRRFAEDWKGPPVLARPLPLPYATEVTVELPLDVTQEGGVASCRARAQLLERHPSRTVDVVGYREVCCDRPRGHNGDHVAILQLALLRKRRARAARWSS